MNSKVTIVTDSTPYLPQELVDQYGLYILPLSVVWGNKVYRDGVDIQADEFYKKLAVSKTLPTTSQVTVHEFQTLFEKLLAEGREIIVLPISSGLSATFQSAIQAKNNLESDRIAVIDTKLVSMALGFQVLAVARAAEAGASLAECQAIAEKAYDLIGVYFTVDTLEFLHRGGRINSAKRLMGTALNLKPLLEIRDGKIEAVGSVRSQRKALDRMQQMAEKKIDGRTPLRISVFHAGVPELAEKYKARLDKAFQPVESILTHVSPVIGTHVGPGTISIAFMAGEIE
ncbi:MAG: DegV family protein [Anaerolineaceae bacterium]|nr:DegV family protein [Anaerolineaceae bacterium]